MGGAGRDLGGYAPCANTIRKQQNRSNAECGAYVQLSPDPAPAFPSTLPPLYLRVCARARDGGVPIGRPTCSLRCSESCTPCRNASRSFSSCVTCHVSPSSSRPRAAGSCTSLEWDRGRFCTLSCACELHRDVLGTFIWRDFSAPSTACEVLDGGGFWKTGGGICENRKGRKPCSVKQALGEYEVPARRRQGGNNCKDYRV